MPVCIKVALHKFQHPVPARPEHAQHTWNPPVYEAKTKYIEEIEDSPPLSPRSNVTGVQQLGGTIIYYARAVDPPLIMPVNVLVSEQTKANKSNRRNSRHNYQVAQLLLNTP
jgi:hypothetical protein